MKNFLLAVLLSLLLLSIAFNEVSGKELKCYTREAGEDSDTEKTCSGNDVVCVTAIDRMSNIIRFKRCGERNSLKKECDGVSDFLPGVDCNDPCGTDLCNDEK